MLHIVLCRNSERNPGKRGALDNGGRELTASLSCLLCLSLSRRMTRQEKQLYHQIHPAKLLIDGGTTPFSLYFFWHHLWIIAIAVSLIPSILVSLILIRFVALDRYRDSSFGRYINRYMSVAMQGIRFLGFLVMAAGAWFNAWWMILLGLLIVLLGWLRGLIFPSRK